MSKFEQALPHFANGLRVLLNVPDSDSVNKALAAISGQHTATALAIGDLQARIKELEEEDAEDFIIIKPKLVDEEQTTHAYRALSQTATAHLVAVQSQKRKQVAEANGKDADGDSPS